ncbi:MAG: mechanosensitive ion channel family protein [Anaerolineae bacterium]|nr:mechanosensitive ion channel family protein [Anaerolineae bacterium]
MNIDFNSIDLRDIGVRLLLIVAALAALWLLRHIVSWLTLRIVKRMMARQQSDALIERIQVMVTNAVQLIFIAAALFVIQAFVDLDAAGRILVSRLGRTLVIVAIAVLLYRVFSILSVNRNQLYRMTGINLDEALLPFIRVGLQILVIIFAVVIIIQEWGYDVSALIAGFGLGGLAFSLAAQDTIANLFGFSMIVGDRPFNVGEYIKTPDVEGIVEYVGVRSTRIRQLDQALVTVPNKQLANSVIMNWSRLSKRMVNFTMRIAADTSREEIEQVLESIRTMLANRERTDASSVVVYFTNFSETGFELLIRCYVAIADWTEFQREREAINLEIMRIMSEIFKRGGAYAQVIPFKALVNYGSGEPTPAPTIPPDEK